MNCPGAKPARTASPSCRRGFVVACLFSVVLCVLCGLCGEQSSKTKKPSAWRALPVDSEVQSALTPPELSPGFRDAAPNAKMEWMRCLSFHAGQCSTARWACQNAITHGRVSWPGIAECDRVTSEDVIYCGYSMSEKADASSLTEGNLSSGFCSQHFRMTVRYRLSIRSSLCSELGSLPNIIASNVTPRA